MIPTSLVKRWAAFNLVGLAGVAVQLGALAVLAHAASLPTLPATALAVELAVVHNFWWHERWTWRDRRAASARVMLGRFWRFQMLNGAVSLAGNVVMTLALSRGFGMDVVAANAIAIVACSFVNFAASESAVFVSAAPVLLGVAVLGAPQPAWAGQAPATVAAWQAYERGVDARYAAAAAEPASFFAQDSHSADGAAWRPRVLGGEVTATRLQAAAVPGGRVHHWAGAVLVPGATVAGVVARLQAHAGRESEVYEDVLAARLLARDGDRLRVYMKLRRTTVITATFDTEHVVEYRRLGPSRASSRSVAVRIAELGEAGTPRERAKAAGEDHGFLWRLNAYWRFEQVPGGVIVECESVSLSRGIPALLKPVAGPIIDRVAREALENTLATARDFLGGDGGGQA